METARRVAVLVVMAVIARLIPTGSASSGPVTAKADDGRLTAIRMSVWEPTEG